jgi:hypothetical protein
VVRSKAKNAGLVNALYLGVHRTARRLSKASCHLSQFSIPRADLHHSTFNIQAEYPCNGGAIVNVGGLLGFDFSTLFWYGKAYHMELMNAPYEAPCEGVVRTASVDTAASWCKAISQSWLVTSPGKIRVYGNLSYHGTAGQFCVPQDCAGTCGRVIPTSTKYGRSTFNLIIQGPNYYQEIPLRFDVWSLGIPDCLSRVDMQASDPVLIDDGTVLADISYSEVRNDPPNCGVQRLGSYQSPGASPGEFQVDVQLSGSETSPERWTIALANIADIFSLGDFVGQGDPLACYPNGPTCPAPGAEEDYVINYDDLRIIAYAQATTSGSCGFLSILDSNGDGSIDYDTELSQYICNSMADLNGDNFVDFFDYDDFVAAFETDGCLADVDMNGFLDFFDYDLYVRASSLPLVFRSPVLAAERRSALTVISGPVAPDRPALFPGSATIVPLKCGTPTTGPGFFTPRSV